MNWDEILGEACRGRDYQLYAGGMTHRGPIESIEEIETSDGTAIKIILAWSAVKPIIIGFRWQVEEGVCCAFDKSPDAPTRKPNGMISIKSSEGTVMIHPPGDNLDLNKTGGGYGVC